MDRRTPFRLPAEPKTGLDLLWWTYFEWPRLVAWSQRLPRRRVQALYLRALPWLASLAIVCYLLSSALIATTDLPLHFPDQFRSGVVAAFKDTTDWGGRFYWLVADSALAVLRRLALGLAVGLASGLAEGLAFGLALGLALGLAFGLAGGLAAGLALGLALGLAFGLALGLAVGLAWGLAFGLAGGLAVGLTDGLLSGVGLGGGFCAGWLAGWLRLPVYVPQSLIALVRLDLRHNPYLYDVGVRLPLWRARRRLSDESFADPETGAAFGAFLLEYRPFQAGLAAAVLHAANAGGWRLHPLEPGVLVPPLLPKEQTGFQPSADWQAALAALRADLCAVRTQTNIRLKRDAFQHFYRRLEALRRLTLAEPPRWNRWYLQALDAWLDEAGKERRNLADQASALEPMAPNRYRAGTPLRPGQDQAVFFGREDLRQALAREVLTATDLT
ncbi:hypothetical protein [uncultured Thiodictyon sp.]|uniref:hypothetical protein n=1 Tax=uncultured Thiodictyon sp. TaxID=1846217 RepID=UPI0025EDAAB3|nr:hypothetical protein [uncultured Thiodictyon sp.]